MLSCVRSQLHTYDELWSHRHASQRSDDPTNSGSSCWLLLSVASCSKAGLVTYPSEVLCAQMRQDHSLMQQATCHMHKGGGMGGAKAAQGKGKQRGRGRGRRRTGKDKEMDS